MSEKEIVLSFLNDLSDSLHLLWGVTRIAGRHIERIEQTNPERLDRYYRESVGKAWVKEADIEKIPQYIERLKHAHDLLIGLEDFEELLGVVIQYLEISDIE